RAALGVPLSLSLEQGVRGGDEFHIRMRGTKRAELTDVRHQLVFIDDRRIVLGTVIAVQPGGDGSYVFLARRLELLAGPGEKVDVVRQCWRGPQQDCRREGRDDGPHQLLRSIIPRSASWLLSRYRRT